MILTGDLHLRKTVPRCRNQTEEQWYEHQRDVLTFIVDVCNARDEDLYINGDVFDKSIVHPSIISLFLGVMSKLRTKCYVDYGNHDQASRSDDLTQTSFGVLESVKKFDNTLRSISESQAWVPYGNKEPIGNGPVLFLHELTVEKHEDAKFFDAVSAKELLNTYQDFKYIATSDNHKAFVVEIKGRKVLNPGCITKQSASYKDAKLLVYSLDVETGEHEAIYLPEDSSVVDDSYLVEDKERENRINAFVDSLKKSGEVTLSFRDNVFKEVATSKMKPLTAKYIKDIMEGVNGEQ